MSNTTPELTVAQQYALGLLARPEKAKGEAGKSKRPSLIDLQGCYEDQPDITLGTHWEEAGPNVRYQTAGAYTVIAIDNRVITDHQTKSSGNPYVAMTYPSWVNVGPGRKLTLGVISPQPKG